MDAEHGNGITHAEYAPLLELKLVIITDAWPASFALQLLMSEHRCLLSYLILSSNLLEQSPR